MKSNTRRQLIERIVRTDPFQKSTRLTSLLYYLADHSLREDPDILTEHRIGVEVFGKPADYSPTEDSAVRVHVRQLRLRLHEYFGSRGKNENITVDIPKGAYTLEFHGVDRESAALVESPTPPSNTKPVRKWKAIQAAFRWIVLLLALVCALGWYRTAREVHKPLPWPLNEVIQGDRPTSIVIADANFGVFRTMDSMRSAPPTIDDYMDRKYQKDVITQQMEVNEGGVVRYVAGSQLTSVADVFVSTVLVKLAGERSDHLVIRWARDLNRRDIDSGNLIFVGSKSSNPWVELYEDKLNFRVTDDPVARETVFLNRSPLPGEEKTYRGVGKTGRSGDDFASMCVVPGKLDSGNVLILQGLSQEGTEALSVLLSDAAARTRLQKVLEAENGGSQPAYFEALVRARSLAGAPMSIDIVATRIIKP